MKKILCLLLIVLLSITFFIIGVFGLAILFTLLEYSPFLNWYNSMGIGGNITIWQMILIGIFSISLSIELCSKIFKFKE